MKDILHARLKTTGASELKFEVKQHKFLVIDVGGQRCQRTQWYVHSLIFRLSSSAFFPFYPFKPVKKVYFIFFGSVAGN